jgi:hypothetical protein
MARKVPTVEMEVADVEIPGGEVEGAKVPIVMVMVKALVAEVGVLVADTEVVMVKVLKVQ